MPRIREQALKDVEDALEQYVTAVERATLARTTKRTYISHARDFVRWLNYQFEPGSASPTGGSPSASRR